MRLILPLLVLLASCVQQTYVDENLPPIASADRVVVTVNGVETKTLNDPHIVREVLALVNGYERGWEVTWSGPPVASTKLSFYAGDAFVGDFGLGTEFITRTHGNFWSQRVPSPEIDHLRSVLDLGAPPGG